MLEIKDLTKYYKNVLGVKEVNLNINEGEIFGFIGPNGSGKSTTIKCIMNLINKTNGKILFNNEELTDKNYMLKEKIGYLPGDIYLYDNMKVYDLIEYNKTFYKTDCTKKANELIDKLKLDTSKKVNELSLGNLKKLGIVLALMHSPKLIIMDEASSGLDPIMQNVFYEILKKEKELGNTIFFSTHILSEIKKICDRVGIIKDGIVIEIKDIENLNIDSSFIVSVNCEEIKSLERLGKIIDKKKDYIKFLYNDDINKLMNILSKMKISKLLIESPEIEEVFMHYYEV